MMRTSSIEKIEHIDGSFNVTRPVDKGSEIVEYDAKDLEILRDVVWDGQGNHDDVQKINDALGIA